MYYTCQDCKYTFEAKSADHCNDCGSENIRPATEEEIAEYLAYRKEFGNT